MRSIANGMILTTALGLGACSSATIDAGYVNFEMSGDVGYARGAGAIAGRADVASGLGQGDKVGAPYGRIELSNDAGLFGSGMFVSGFLYENTGTGTLTANYGNIVAGTQVDSDFSIINAKIGFYLSFDIGDVLFIRPGIAADVFLPDMTVTSRLVPSLSEQIDDPGGVPLPYLQVGLDTGVVSGFVEVGYLPLDTKDLNLGSEYDVKSETLDIEAMLRVRPTKYLELFVGYRMFALELEGRLEQDTVDIDIELRGLMFGGGVYW